MWITLLHYVNIVINKFIVEILIYLNFRHRSIDIGLDDSSCGQLLLDPIFLIGKGYENLYIYFE